jgi:uncharacterized membrane protein YphA (DoxX/SURF4 family)
MVGLVFLSEGFLKSIFPETMGSGLFAKLGFEDPDFLASLVGYFEITCSMLILMGLLCRLATIPLFIIICTAIYTTKLPLMAEKGFWMAIHETRTDFCMVIGLIYLFIYGAGRWSMDRLMTQKNQSLFDPV